MENEVKLGMNRTGVQMSPMQFKEMLADAAKTSPPPGRQSEGIAQVRRSYALEAERIGSVPVPGSMKGMLQSGKEMVLKGKRPQVFIDKLGERAAFERSGTRLYDAVLVKALAFPDALPKGALEQLRHIRDDEEQHFRLVVAAIESLGADPTAMTPCADIAGIEGMGWVQIVTDPRTTLPQALHALQSAELVDNAAWELLIALAQQFKEDELAADFQQALDEEAEHLLQIKTLLQQAVISDASMVGDIKKSS